MIAHCTKCHHEWQAYIETGDCSECGAPGKKLSDDYLESKMWLEFVKKILSEAGDDAKNKKIF